MADLMPDSHNFFWHIKTRFVFQRFVCILVANETISLASELIIGFADFLLLYCGLLFFRFGLFQPPDFQ